MTEPASPDPTIVLDLIDAFRRSKTMFAAVSLGVFDALAESPRSASQLARDLCLNLDALGRLLDGCVALGLLDRVGEQFANTPSSAAFLCRNSPRRITSYINYSNQVLWKLWDHLDDAIREGNHRWPQAFGMKGPIFANFFRSDEAKREFLMGMHGYGLICSPGIVSAFDLSRFRTLVDLGGATGHLAIAACEHFPELRAIVYELPEAAELAREIIAASAVAERVLVQTGDFFNDPLPEADLFSLGRILHDWTEAKIASLLVKIYERLPIGGGLLIVEKLIDDNRRGPTTALMQSLNMLLCTEGKERTLSEYKTLLHRAGFSDVRGYPTNSPLDAVFAVKRG